MLEVTLTCVSTAAGAKMGSTKKKLPVSTTLAALRTLCEKLCKVRLRCIRCVKSCVR